MPRLFSVHLARQAQAHLVAVAVWAETGWAITFRAGLTSVAVPVLEVRLAHLVLAAQLARLDRLLLRPTTEQAAAVAGKTQPVA